MSFLSALPMLLDSTGTASALLGAAPRGTCAEHWLCEHPEVLIPLQKKISGSWSTGALRTDCRG